MVEWAETLHPLITGSCPMLNYYISIVACHISHLIRIYSGVSQRELGESHPPEVSRLLESLYKNQIITKYAPIVYLSENYEAFPCRGWRTKTK